MADIDGDLWQFNLARIVIIDVSDDYALMQPPLPTECYPVLREMLVPRHGLIGQFPKKDLVDGYLYDWHERPMNDFDAWYVGVVRKDLDF